MDIARPSRKKEIQRRRMMYIVFGIAGFIMLTVAINSLEPAAREAERDSLWIEKVQRGEMLLLVRGPGTLVPEEIRWIAAETSGRVERILIDPGARIDADTVILELSNPEVEQAAGDAELQLRAVEAEYLDLDIRLQSQILDQEANLARVKADFKGAELQLVADKKLDEEGLNPKITLMQSILAAEQLTVRYEIEQKRLAKTAESIQAQLAVKRAEVEQQRALYRLRKQQLESLKVRSPLVGILQEVPAEEGQQVLAGTNLARVAQPDELKAEIRVNETQAKDIQVGQVARIDTRNGIIEGRVARIDPSVQQGSVTVEVKLIGEYPPGARPDLSVDGTIELDRLDDVLYCGRPAYGQANSTVGLFKVDADGEYANLVKVTMGRTSVKAIEIITGLEEGDEVILSDTNQFDDVDRIRLK
jgi:HlyD family secretion protein